MDEIELLSRSEMVERRLADGFEFWQSLDESIDKINPTEKRDDEWNTFFELLCNLCRTHNDAAGYIKHEHLEAQKKAAAAKLHSFIMNHVDQWVDDEMEE